MAKLVLTKLLTTFVSAFTKALGTIRTCVIGSVCVGCFGGSTAPERTGHTGVIINLVIIIIDVYFKMLTRSIGDILR